MSTGWRKGFADVVAAIKGTLADATNAGSMTAAEFLKLAALPASALATAWGAGFDLVPVANWDLAVVRTFLLDPVNGSDSNVGYSDGAGPYNPATLAKKTTAGMKAVLPVNFANRKFRLIMAAGAYADGLDKLLTGAQGMGPNCVVRGTATSSTANTTAFSDDANDRIYQGFGTASGMNAAGYNPTGAPTTTVVQCLKVGGAAPGFGAEPALPLGARIRFDAATTTAALRNICRVVNAVSGTDTVTLDSALPAVPVAGDVFYLETSGLSFPAHTIAVGTTGTSNTLQLCGIAVPVGTLTIGTGDITVAGCYVAALTVTGSGRYSQSNAFTETTTSTSVIIGGCMRSEGAANYQRGASVSANYHVALGLTTFFGNVSTPTGGIGCFVCSSALSLNANGNQGLFTTAGTRVIAPGAGLASITMAGQWQVGGITLTNAGAKPAIRMTQSAFNFLSFQNGAVAGSTGNNDVGLDCSAANYSLILIGTVPTVTGALGDVRVAGGLIITWAQAAAGYIDARGNQFISTAAASRLVGKFSGVMITAGGGATTTYAADYSAGQTANQATAQQYPVSVRMITKLRLCAPSGTPADSGLTATLYKNGIATTMTCTVAAAQAAGTKAVDTAHPILFADADTYDVRINGASASNIAFTATLEGP